MMELPAFLKTFNFPNPKLPNGKRDVTDVPAQALTLLNDPFVVAAAKHWAEQLVLDRERTPGPRIRRMFQRAFGRTPVPDERRRWQQAIAGFSTTGDLMADQSAWAQAAHTLFNTKEFIYYR